MSQPIDGCAAHVLITGSSGANVSPWAVAYCALLRVMQQMNLPWATTVFGSSRYATARLGAKEFRAAAGSVKQAAMHLPRRRSHNRGEFVSHLLNDGEFRPS